ncbi:hypothetical protein B0H10DRAFT_1968821 [Mycena sp. CBHHK59/15]|nr:hypothetical protein B0H10DRAFT_1968821 [Mycena sp. CBHHK59/15]
MRVGGQMDSQKGKKRGSYNVGGPSKRSIQEKSKKLRDDFNNGVLNISATELDRQIKALKAQGSGSQSAWKQQDLASMFSKSAAKRPRTVSISSDDIEIISLPVDPQFPPSKRAKTHDPSPDTSASVPSSSALDPAHGEAEFTVESELLEDLEVPPEQLEKDARSCEGDAAVDSIVAADDIADWVDTVLDDAASKEPAELEALEVASLKTARKEQNYRNTVLFAALADFYRWLPRMGRLRAALRVAKNHGRLFQTSFNPQLCVASTISQSRTSFKNC